MAPRVPNHRASLRRPLKISRGYFYPGEVVRILQLENMDYRQLRRLFRIVREQAGQTTAAEGKWARFTFRDLVALKAALDLAGGEQALAPGRRLRLQDIEHICQRLNEIGFSSPLTEIAFRRNGRTVIAQVEGVSFEPTSGQMLLGEVETAVARYLEENPDRSRRGAKRRARFDQEVHELREAGPHPRRSEARLEVRFR
jgi:hypothetical protein